MPDENVRYGWYSKKQDALIGASEYATPGGEQVTITETSSGPECPNKWDDCVPVGRVLAFIRRLRSGSGSNRAQRTAAKIHRSKSVDRRLLAQASLDQRRAQTAAIIAAEYAEVETEVRRLREACQEADFALHGCGDAKCRAAEEKFCELIKCYSQPGSAWLEFSDS